MLARRSSTLLVRTEARRETAGIAAVTLHSHALHFYPDPHKELPSLRLDHF